jgi:hypothetical protein
MGHKQPVNRVATLQAVAESMRSTEVPSTDRKDRERLALEVNCFCVSLLFNGRPGKEKQVTITYGHSMNCIIEAGAVLKPSPWNNTKDDPFPAMHIFEVHGPDLSGWWAEIEPNIMAFLPFSGRAGLDEYDTACLISESQYPDKELVDWVSGILNGGAYASSDLISEIPDQLLEHVGKNFKSKSRLLALCNDRGSLNRPLFSVYEHDINIPPPEAIF